VEERARAACQSIPIKLTRFDFLEECQSRARHARGDGAICLCTRAPRFALRLPGASRRRGLRPTLRAPLWRFAPPSSAARASRSAFLALRAAELCGPRSALRGCAWTRMPGRKSSAPCRRRSPRRGPCAGGASSPRRAIPYSYSRGYGCWAFFLLVRGHEEPAFAGRPRSQQPVRCLERRPRGHARTRYPSRQADWLDHWRE
jgi:hypothetical protein